MDGKNLHESGIGPTLDIQDDVPLPEDGPDVVLQDGGRELGVGSAQPGHELAGAGELQPVPPDLPGPAQQLLAHSAVRRLAVVVLLLAVVVQFVHPTLVCQL